ncbi:MAG: PQQ-binding-like beta-propeller repeat protein [Planctomycetes bacterium]|nr:PQQ-binding-like beta-propeller repeat protein [Planctomycetota bacterium]
MRSSPQRAVRAYASALCFILVVVVGPALAGNWPQFRGPQASGVGDGDPPTEWQVESGQNIKWKTAIPGLGHSCPIVWEKRVFLTTAVSSDDDNVQLTKGWEAAAGHPAKDPDTWTWQVLCLDVDTGKILWQRDACHGTPKNKRHPKASHANCTPATDGTHLVVLFGSEGLLCYDLDGKLLWRVDMGILHASPKGSPDLQWGYASSPIIYKDLIVVQCDCHNTNFWAVYDIKTGREVRRIERQEDSTWSTPNVFEIGGRPQIVLNGYKHMGAYDLNTGEELWKLRGGGDVPVPTPLFAQGLIFVTNGHGGPMPIYAIQPEARGDVTPGDDNEPEGMAWWDKRRGSYIPTPIVYGENVYVCNDNSILSVMDAKTGELRYRKRLADGRANYTASAVAACGKVYFTSEDGDVHVLSAGNDYELLATNAMGETCMATPAIADGRLFIRTRSQLYCIGK